MVGWLRWQKGAFAACPPRWDAPTSLAVAALFCLAACSAAEGDLPLSRAEGDESDARTEQTSPKKDATQDSEVEQEVRERKLGEAVRGQTGAVQAMPTPGSDVDELVPPPAGLLDQSDPHQAPGYRSRLNEGYRARIDELKRELEHMVDGPSKERLLRELEEASEQYRATREGLVDTHTIIGNDGSTGMTEEQRARLLRLMARYDMTKPGDVAEWNRVKSEVLGR